MGSRRDGDLTRELAESDRLRIVEKHHPLLVAAHIGEDRAPARRKGSGFGLLRAIVLLRAALPGAAEWVAPASALHLLRLLVERAGLIRSAGLWFELTPLGRALLEPGRRGTLQALLFRHAFWDMDLSRFVRVDPRGLPGWWPQGEIGVILWGLSAVAEDWQNAAALTALCTIPDDELPETCRGPAPSMFVWRILRPLHWFGLLEYRGHEETRDVAWLKSVLFDRFLSFEVRLSDKRGSSH